MCLHSWGLLPPPRLPAATQVFVRDFIPSALAFLMNGEPEIARTFLLKTLRLQSWEKRVDVFTLGGDDLAR